MPTFRTAAKRLVRPAIATSSIAALAVTSFSFQPAVSAEQGNCAVGAEERILEWSDSADPSKGAVWNVGTNQFAMGDDLTVTASLVDSGPLDEASTLINSNLLAQATPGTTGSLVWNLDTAALVDNSSSTLLFEFSTPVESFSVVIIDVDAKSNEATSIGWHDKITGVAQGENVSVGMIANDPTLVTIEGSSAWAAEGQGKTANESSAANVTMSATGTVFSAGLTYHDGPRSGDNPERHAVGVSSISVCLPAEFGTAADDSAVTPSSDPSADSEADDSSAPEVTTATTLPEPTTTEPTTTEAPTTTTELTTTEAPTTTTEPTTTEDEVEESTAATPGATAEDTPATEPATTVDESNEVTPPSSRAATGSLNVTTTASEPVSNGGETYSFSYLVTAVNDEASTLESVQLSHDLEASLGDAESWRLDNVAMVEGPCATSTTYDGDSDTELLASGATLAPTTSCTVRVNVTVTPATDTQQFEASASATAVDPASDSTTTSESNSTTVTTTPEARTLAFTGTESEDIAISGALLLILGATLMSYRERFLTIPVGTSTITDR